LATLFPTFLVTFLATPFDATLFDATLFLATALVTCLMVVTVCLFLAIRVDSDGYPS